MPPEHEPAAGGRERLPLAVAADLHDHLMTVCNDLDRLQGLLAHACDALLASFAGANDETDTLQQALRSSPVLDRLRGHLGQAVTALQFQDMASQLVAHAQRRLRSCADRLARDAIDDDDDDAFVEEPPLRPNPVTQDEMDAGSVELF